jgi:hypothetical protein
VRDAIRTELGTSLATFDVSIGQEQLDLVTSDIIAAVQSVLFDRADKLQNAMSGMEEAGHIRKVAELLDL